MPRRAGIFWEIMSEIPDWVFRFVFSAKAYGAAVSQAINKRMSAMQPDCV